MESLHGLDEVTKRIARRHNIDINKIDFQQVRRNRDKREQEKAIQFTKESININRKRMFNSSLVSDFSDLKSDFADFKVNTQEQAKELAQAKNIANRIYKGDKGNFLFTGKPGLGKTMLAVSILSGLNSLDCPLTCYFLSFEMFISMQRQSFGDQYIKQQLIKVEKCAKNCDVLVLDDLGTETAMKSDGNDEARNFTQEMLFKLADYRKNKVNIVTSNNQGKKLQKMYHPKIISRLIAKDPNNVIQFEGKDQRP